jgi:DNA repair exonuclease SbcCD ATPase subunit
MMRAKAVSGIVLSALLSGCVAQEADLRQTEKVLHQRIKQQDDQFSQSRARQSQEISTLRDQELPQLRGEVERVLRQAQDLQAKQEDIRYRLAQLEQQTKKTDSDNTTRHVWVQKSLDNQDAKVAARLEELSRAMETAMAALKKDIVEAVQRTNDTLAKRVDVRLEEQHRGVADNQQRLDQVSQKFTQFNQALTGFREALMGLNDRVEQGERIAAKTLEAAGNKIAARFDEQDRRIETLAKSVARNNHKPVSRQLETKQTQKSSAAPPPDPEAAYVVPQEPRGGKGVRQAGATQGGSVTPHE